MSYAIMRAEKLKTHQIHFSQNHNERNHKSYSNEDINLEKTKDNYHLIESKNYSRDTEYIIQKNYQQKLVKEDFEFIINFIEFLEGLGFKEGE